MLLLLLYIALLVFFWLEKRSLDRYRAGFTHIIHINGIRGKTTVCRLLDAALREKYKVFTKTTGTSPRVIGVDGTDRPLRRRGAANIREQAAMMRRAGKEGAEILILECMAVEPQLQKISQQQILGGDISVITNVRYDHTFEMGESLEEIADALCHVIPQGGLLFTGAEEFAGQIERQCRLRGSGMVLCRSAGAEDENRAIAREIARTLGVGDSRIDAGFHKAQPDFGAAGLYSLVSCSGEPVMFYNLFSANDPMSTLRKIQELQADGRSLSFIYNNRWDRPDRLLLFAKHFFPAFPHVRVFLMGDSPALARRLLLRATPGLALKKVRSWQECLDLPGGGLLVGTGNIKGEALRMLEALEERMRAE